MSNVSVVGLGMMGAALAKTLLADGREVTVWNRDREKAKPLESAGARVAESLAEAVSRSPIILVCIRDYAATRELFAADEVAAVLTDRCLVQLSTGKPREAIDDKAWFEQFGARYLDGAILAPPVAIAPDERMRSIAETVKTGSFDRVINSVRVWHEGLQQVRGQAALGQCNTELLDFIDDKFQRAAACGYSELDMAAMIKVFAPA